MRRRFRFSYQRGLTYVESMVAVLVLGVCLAPVASTMQSLLGRQAAVSETFRDGACLRELMETIVNQSHASLLTTATSSYLSGSFSNPTSHSVAATATCPLARNAYILRFDPTAASFITSKDDVLYVRVEDAAGRQVSTLVTAK